MEYEDKHAESLTKELASTAAEDFQFNKLSSFARTTIVLFSSPTRLASWIRSDKYDKAMRPIPYFFLTVGALLFFSALSGESSEPGLAPKIFEKFAPAIYFLLFITPTAVCLHLFLGRYRRTLRETISVYTFGTAGLILIGVLVTPWPDEAVPPTPIGIILTVVFIDLSICCISTQLKVFGIGFFSFMWRGFIAGLCGSLIAFILASIIGVSLSPFTNVSEGKTASSSESSS